MKLASLKAQAKRLKQHTLTVYFAARDPRTPFLVRVLAVLVAAYALSPIDLIPDFIPVVGYLDDIIRPQNTRWRICRALSVLRAKNLQNPWKKHDNLPL